MKLKEFLEEIKALELNPDAEVCIVDNDQNNCWDILELRTCLDNASDYNRTFLDIAIDLKEKEFLKTALTDLYTEAITKSEELLLGDFKDYFDTEFTDKLAELIYVNVSNY